MVTTNPDSHGKTRQFVSAFVLLAALVATGCADGTITSISRGGSAPLRAKVAEVTVSSASVVRERRARYDKLDGDRSIQRAIIDRLVEDGHFDSSGDMRIEVEITVFKLRSVSTALFLGFLAGEDKLYGKVSVSQDEDIGRRYRFELRSSEEWYFKVSASGRFGSLANELAEKISTLFDGASS
jgi:hypothetical protein